MRGWPRPGGLWRHPDFVRLWGAATVSTFGSLVTRTALPFTAIIALDASPLDLSLLAAAELVPGFALGLVAGVWVDRVRRRPLLIAADLGRAAVLATVPVAALAGALSLGQLYAVAAAASALSVVFDVAHQAYLPALVGRGRLVEGNGKIAAAGSVAEFAAFGAGGWLVQRFSGPIAVGLDAASFVWSALLLARIRAPEADPAPFRDGQATAPGSGLWREIGEGLRLVAGDPVLRALAGSNAVLNLGYRVVGAAFLLYVNQELGFGPAVLGVVFAVGGVGALLGALLAGRLTRFGLGPILIAALALVGLGQGLVPLAAGTGLVGLAILVAQQLVADPAATVYDVGASSLRQALVPDRLRGRVGASVRVLEVGAMLVGALVGGVLGETVGLRATLGAGAGVFFLAAAWLLASPVRRLGPMPFVADAEEDDERGPDDVVVGL